MTRVIKLKRGLDINLAGKAALEKKSVAMGKVFALCPDDFLGVKPKVVVKEGDTVKAGDALFVNKDCPEVKFASPVSGKVIKVERGDRRKLLSVQVEGDAQQEFTDFGKKDVAKLDGDAVKTSLLEAGLFGYINQLPYAVSTRPDTTPKAIFVSAFRDMPLAGDFDFEVKGQEQDFATGIAALAKIAKVYVGVKEGSAVESISFAGNVEVVEFQGKCPAGNVGVQVNNIDPVNKGETVWTVEPTAVLFFGRLFNTGKVDLTRTVALGGDRMKEAYYADIKVGAQIDLKEILDLNGKSIRVINGNPLTGKVLGTVRCEGCCAEKPFFLGAHTSEVTAIKEGDHADEMLGWILPRFKQFSVNRSYFSWLFPRKKGYKLDARIKGGERHMIMSGEYDKVMPMDIYPEYLIKAIITGNIDKQEQLGIYEVSPEDFALAEFVDSSKLELQKIVRQGLDILRKENE